jgi:hypothetical protein
VSAPSLLHESRVQILNDLADLAGYTVVIDLYAGLRPDVSRLHHTAPAVMIADAKATERPEDAPTRARLLKYILAAHEWQSAGFVVALAICHGADPTRRWLDSIGPLVAIAGCPVLRSTYAALDTDTAVSMVSLHRAPSRDGLPIT